MVKNVIYIMKWILILIVIILYINYKNAKKFRLCTTCTSSEIHIIENDVLPKNQVKLIIDVMHDKDKIIHLNGKKNFSQAQGTKINYMQILKFLPSLEKTLLTPTLLESVRNKLQKSVNYGKHTNIYRIFLRMYENDGDFLEWHYDNNFTKGARYTLVMPLYVDDCNTSNLLIKDRKDGFEKEILLNVGQSVLYNGSEVYHRVTKQTQGCKRLVVIIPFYENEDYRPLGKIREKVRDVTDKVLSL